MSFFNNIFDKNALGKEEYNIPTTTDMHSHLIPGIDDGSHSLNESIYLIKYLKKLGYKKLITTPHIMSDFYKNTPENIRSGLDKLKKELIKENIEIEIEIAAEYYIDDIFLKKIENEDLLTFGDNYVLIETNLLNYSKLLREAIWELSLKKYKPVFAHVERYAYFRDNFELYHELKEMNVLYQINLASLAGFYTKAVKKIAERLIEENLVDFIGTDAHHKEYLDATQKARYNPIMKKLAEAKLLNGEL
ncbi:MAG: CpsB/CapC family capsule biosynthesis tyrosine phosphatase [Bacteroidota bacterium]|nr:CpsB/CapC family capsule biosynthesis tyrosine phosphatase [Bacteroidota bacterium]